MTLIAPRCGFEQFTTWAGPAAGLTHRWPLSSPYISGTTVTDIVGGLNGTGSGLGSAASPRPGLNTASFDGNAYISLASNPVTFSSDHSIFGWFNLTNASALGKGTTSQTFTNFYTAANNSCRLANFESIPGGFAVGGPNSPTVQYKTNNQVFTNGTWVHGGYVYTSGSATIYINGATVSQASGNYGFSMGSGNLIGAKTTTTGNITGALYNIVTYNRAVSAAEATAIYAAQ
jgi:hypothetical protein